MAKNLKSRGRKHDPSLLGGVVIDQLGIACTGAVAVYLSQDMHERRRRCACLFGLAGQPFWFYATASADQWGMFALSFLYAWSWLRGFRLYWWPSFRTWMEARL